MNRRNFNAFRGPKAERFSGGHFYDAVQTLDNARGNRAFGPEPVEDQAVAALHLINAAGLDPREVTVGYGATEACWTGASRLSNHPAANRRVRRIGGLPIAACTRYSTRTPLGSMI
jgi:hypothetical protein